MELKAIRKLAWFLLLVLLSLSIRVCGVKVQETNAHSQCNGSIAECQEENEILMGSETARRFLEEKRYISYGALSRDQPACSGARGQAYSSNSECLGPAANPYHRGCSKYYRCRSDTQQCASFILHVLLVYSSQKEFSIPQHMVCILSILPLLF